MRGTSMQVNDCSSDVIVLGAGIGGLTAAHELAERGYSVLVLEASEVLGGKSRSIPCLSPHSDGREALPGEHGFRFFPGFYRHLPETMQRIPLPGGGSVADNLVETGRTLALSKAGQWELPNRLRSSAGDVSALATFLYETLMGANVGVPGSDVMHYIRCILTVMTACDERRWGELEKIPAWDFYQAGTRSREYQDYVVSAVTRSLVACRAEEMSARSNAVIGFQILMDTYRSCSDRVLNAPSNEAWLTPWVQHLKTLGVEFRVGSGAKKLHLEGQRVRSVELTSGEMLSAPHYVGALPVEIMQQLATADVRAAAPALEKLDLLQTAWMNGVIFYFDQKIDGNHGHTIFMDSPWALTSVFQHQFWERGLSDYGMGDVKSILSVCISDFNAPGILHKKTAKLCTRDEIREEVWAQILEHCRGELLKQLESARLVDFFVDPALDFDAETMTNDSPLLINTAGSWQNRPDADVGLENFFLASDYVRTHTDVATMESANEAAKRAVNEILERRGDAAPRCEILPLEEPLFLLPFKALDRLRYEAGLPHLLDVLPEFSTEALRVVGEKATSALRKTDSIALVLKELGVLERLPEWESRIVRAVANWTSGAKSREKTSQRPPNDVAPFQKQGTQLDELVRSTFGGAPDPVLVEDLSELSQRCLQGLHTTEAYFRRYQDSHDQHHVDAALASFLSAPGKRVRALCSYLGASLLRRHISDDVHTVAIIAESVHAASLIHDDIIDDAAQRRGRPTISAQHGVASGLLAGDLLLARAVQSLYRLERRDLADDLFIVVDQMVSAESAQLTARMSGTTSLDEYLEIVDGKTARLFGWACSAGATVGNCPPSWVRALRQYGLHLGTAFQLIDDALDLDETARETGKEHYSDVQTGTLTYPVMHARAQVPDRWDQAQSRHDLGAMNAILKETGALEETRRLAGAYAQRAILALAPIRHSAAKSSLIQLVSHLVTRRR